MTLFQCLTEMMRRVTWLRQCPDLKGSLPSECMMAVWVLSVAASLYILLHTGHGRGSWNASFLWPSLDWLSHSARKYFNERWRKYFVVTHWLPAPPLASVWPPLWGDSLTVWERTEILRPSHLDQKRFSVSQELQDFSNHRRSIRARSGYFRGNCLYLWELNLLGREEEEESQAGTEWEYFVTLAETPASWLCSGQTRRWEKMISWLILMAVTRICSVNSSLETRTAARSMSARLMWLSSLRVQLWQFFRGLWSGWRHQEPWQCLWRQTAWRRGLDTPPCTGTATPTSGPPGGSRAGWGGRIQSRSAADIRVMLLTGNILRNVKTIPRNSSHRINKCEKLGQIRMVPGSMILDGV